MIQQEYLIFDIETKSNSCAIEFMPEPTPPKNYKDPAKIDAWIDAKRDEQENEAALDPDFGKIVAIGHKIHPGGEVFSEIHDDERSLITRFWDCAQQAGGHLCGYNIINFDLPYLMRRSMDLGITVRCRPVIARYRTEPVRDLMQILYNWDKPKGLKFVANRYGIEIPYPDVDGSNVANMSQDELKRYVESDIAITAKLYDMMDGTYWTT